MIDTRDTPTGTLYTPVCRLHAREYRGPSTYDRRTAVENDRVHAAEHRRGVHGDTPAQVAAWVEQGALW